jgi:hypothetical protein
MRELLVLIPKDTEQNKPTKILDKNLQKIRSFDSGFKFYFETIEYTNFHSALEAIFKEQNWFLVLGKLTEYGQKLHDANECGPRRKKKGTPTIQDRDGVEIVLDLDDHKIEGFNALNPEPAIKKWLAERKITCDVTWQITSSQKLNSEEARIRLYFEADRELPLQKRKAWAQSPEIMADGSVFTCSQPIYTAPPIIEGGKDPIKKRNGFIKGTKRSFSIPHISEEKRVKYESHRGGLQYDFKETSLPEEVLSGQVYRRYFMPMAFHYANLLKGDEEAIFHIIASKARQVKSREFDAENVMDYIRDAIDKINDEDEVEQAAGEVLTQNDFKEYDIIEEIPEFPENIMESWPEPWPMLWRNFKNIPRELTEPLLIPTILSLNGFLLRANYVTSMNRRPNMFFLNLTPSTGNKDVNSKNVIDDLNDIFKEKGGLKTTPFTGLINGESSITSDASFLQCFDEEENLFWVNTEATRIFHQLGTSLGNSSVAALGDKLIEVVDGRAITGKRKVGNAIKQITDPNVQILFYAQPETIERHITTDTVDSGLFGRAMLSIIPNLEFDKDKFSIFLHKGSGEKEVEDEFYAFYMSNAMLFSKRKEKQVLKPSEKSLKILHEWSKEFLFKYMQDDESLLKVLKRMGIAAEQLYCIVLGICRAYDEHMGIEPRKTIPVNPLLPLLEYWTKTKVYAIKNYVNVTLDPLADEIYLIIRECVERKHDKLFRDTDLQILKETSFVNVSIVSRIMRNRPALVRKLEQNNEKRNATASCLRLIELMIKHGILIQKERGERKFVGVAK